MNRTMDSKATGHLINGQLADEGMDVSQTSTAGVAQENSSVLRAQMQQMQKTIAHLSIAQTKVKHKNDN